MPISDFPKRVISEIYSRSAANVYEPIVVRGTFRLAASDLEALISQQGQKAIDAAGSGAILDLPVGTAHFTAQFARRHRGLVVGVDIAHGMVVKTLERAARESLGNLVGIEGDAHALPFASGSFPAAMCTNGLQVMPGLDRTLSEIHRVLAPGGLLQVSVVNLPLGEALPGGISKHLPTMFKSRDAMRRAIQRAGFTIEDVTISRLATLIAATR